MENNDILNIINSILCCYGPFLLILFVSSVLTMIIGILRARVGERLPRRRKGFAGAVGVAQKIERERLKRKRRESKDAQKQERKRLEKQKRAEQRAAHKRYADAVIATSDVRSLTPNQFERYVGMILKRCGYEVTHTGGTNDGGVDLFVRKHGKLGVVQCKRYKPDNRIGSPVVRDLRGVMVRERAEWAFLITSSTFTRHAVEEASREPRVTLLNVQRLNRLVQRLQEKDQ